MTATYNTGKKDLLFVYIKEPNYYNFKQGVDGIYSRPKESIIPWQHEGWSDKKMKLIGLFKDLTEEQCFSLVESNYLDGVGYVYRNYLSKSPHISIYGGRSKRTARKSLESLIKSQGLDPEKTLIIERL